MSELMLRVSGEPATESVPVRDIVEILFRGWKEMLALLFVATAAIGLWIHRTPRTYESELTFLVKNDRADVVVTPGQTIGLQGRQWIDESQINTEIQLLSSRELLRRVVEICGLAETVAVGHPPAAGAIEDAVSDLESSISITPVLKANMIRVSYSSDDPEKSARVLRTLADQYVERNLKVHSASGTYEFFHKQAKLYETQLRDIQARLVAFQKPQNRILLGQQKELLLHKLVDVQSSLSDAEASEQENDKRIDDIRRQIATLSPRVLTQSRRLPNQYSVEHLTGLLTELQNKRTELLGKFPPSDRNILQLEKQIADTQATLEREREGVAVENASDLNPVRQGLEAELAKTQSAQSGLKGRMSALTVQIDGYQQRLSDLEQSTAGYDELVRSQKEAEENYFLYSRKQEEARIADALDQQRIGNLALVEPPQVPAAPRKRITKNTFAVTALALLLVLALTLILGTFRNTVYTSRELEALTGLPVLATVPRNRHLRLEHADVG